MAQQQAYSLGAARVALASVWLYQGLWCKLLSRCPSHLTIVRALPAPVGAFAVPVLWSIGALEVAIAGWVLTGWRSHLAAWAQTILVIAMNAGALAWGRAAIPDPAATILNNLVLLALAWVIADDRR